jgi:Bicoid-interacting protein 3 (Bin3)
MRRTKISLASSPRDRGKKHKHSSPQIGGEGGHRFGNFQNYYSFHPTNERMKLLEETDGILDYIAKDWNSSVHPRVSKSDPDNPAKVNNAGELFASATKKPRLDPQSDETTDLLPTLFHFNYLDVGCNEGDLTMEVAKALASRLVAALKVKKTNAKSEVFKDPPSVRMNVHGCDLDPELIHRAQQKNLPDDDHKTTTLCINSDSDTLIKPVFKVVDVLSDKNMDEALSYHLTSVFSTSMWVHIHGGDDGLRQVLGSLCRKTKHYLIVEPQPSKW